VIHRDIKLENILVGNDGVIKLIDFGVSISQKEKKANMSIAGTPQYMAPEVLTGYYGKECDIWSLGVCMYYLLTGSLPFKSKTPLRMF
jgi:serine/threonine protein kinase